MEAKDAEEAYAKVLETDPFLDDGSEIAWDGVEVDGEV